MTILTLADVRHDHDGTRILWKLLEERPPEANISHSGHMPDWCDHKARVLHHDHIGWYLVLADNVPVGSVYLSLQGEIGIAILKDHQRKGYAREAIRLLMQAHPRAYYLANVAPANARSHAMFTKIGGTIVQSTYRIKA